MDTTSLDQRALLLSHVLRSKAVANELPRAFGPGAVAGVLGWPEEQIVETLIELRDRGLIEARAHYFCERGHHAVTRKLIARQSAPEEVPCQECESLGDTAPADRVIVDFSVTSAMTATSGEVPDLGKLTEAAPKTGGRRSLSAWHTSPALSSTSMDARS